MSVSEQVRRIKLAWERLPTPRPHLRLEVCSPNGQEEIFYLGAHRPHLTPEEIDLLHDIWLRISEEAPLRAVPEHEIVHFALKESEREMAQFGKKEVAERFRRHLKDVKPNGD